MLPSVAAVVLIEYQYGEREHPAQSDGDFRSFQSPTDFRHAEVHTHDRKHEEKRGAVQIDEEDRGEGCVEEKSRARLRGEKSTNCMRGEQEQR